MKTPIFIAALALVASSSGLAAEVVRCLTEPVRDVRMSSIVPGMVAQIHYGEGAFVPKDEVILALESRSEELDIQRRSVMVDTLKASLDRSEMLLENTSSISMEEVDEARSEYQLAVIELELARDALSKKQMVAPFSGVLTDLLMEVGEFCEPPQPILRLVDTRQFYCEANINPVSAAQLGVGDPVVYISESGFGESRIDGEIVFISPVLDPASGLMRIKAVFSNPDSEVRPGEGGFLELPAGS